MPRNTLIALIILALVSCQPRKEVATPLLNYLPENTSVLVKINHLSSLKSELRNNGFISALQGSAAYTDLEERLKPLNYLNDSISGLLAICKSEESVHELLFATKDVDSLFNYKLLDSTAIIENPGFTTISIEGTTLYSRKHKGHRIISTNSDLLTSSVDMAGQWDPGKELNSLYNAAGDEKSATVILNTIKSQSWLQEVLQSEAAIALSQFSEWFSIDIDAGPDYLSGNGVCLTGLSARSLLSLFGETTPLPNSTTELAPESSLAVLSFTFEPFDSFARNQLPFIEQPTALDTLFNTVEEIGFVYLKDTRGMILKTYGAENISQFLEDRESGREEYMGHEIASLKQTDFLNVQFTPLVQDFSANFYTVLEDAFIFAPESAAVREIIRGYTSGATFNKGKVYQSLSATLADESQILLMASKEGVVRLLNDDLSSVAKRDLERSKTGGYSFGGQVIADEGFFHTNIRIQKINPVQRNNTVSPLFTVQLDGAIVTDPQFVTNHRTGKKEIVVQDEENNLYLISTSGKVIWKKALKGRIQGKISQVDLYKNGRLQLAFTTNDQLLVLDRNGKEVLPFNMRFEGGNLNPLAVFDYEGNKEYRLVVTQGSKIFMYNRQGKIVSGFTYTDADSQILRAPKHFRVGSRDYLVFLLEDGTLDIRNRLGQTRVTVKEKFNFSQNEVYLYRNKFGLTDKDGNFYSIDTKGKVSRTRLSLNEYHGIDATSKTLATINDNTLSIKGRKIPLELGVYTHPRIFYLYDTIYVSVTDIQSQQVYMFFSNGNLLPDFPVFGSSTIDMQDMDNDRKVEFVARDQENALVVYRIN